MILDPNKYRASFPTVFSMWERGLAKPDFELVISEIAVSTGIEIAAVCMVLEKLDTRISPIKERLITFYKYDKVIPLKETT